MEKCDGRLRQVSAKNNVGIVLCPLRSERTKSENALEAITKILEQHQRLAPGDYTLAFTCQGDNDDPEVDNDNIGTGVEFHPPDGRSITITEGETTTVDFPLVM